MPQQEPVKARCWDVNVLAKYITTPLLVLENQFDQQQITGELLCLDCKKGIKKQSTEARFLSYYGMQMRDSLLAFSKTHPSRNSVWMPSCFSHTDDLRVPGGPSVAGHSIANAVSLWLDGQNFVILDSQNADGLPHNPACPMF